MRKGSRCKVEPIRSRRSIEIISAMLKNRPRDHCLFIMGINTNLRASDLVAITAGKVRGKKVGDVFEIREKKTGKVRFVTMNRPMHEAIESLLSSRHFLNRDPIFWSRKGGAIGTKTVYRMVKRWCGDVGLQGNYGAHTMRKTWGYMQRTVHHVDIEKLMDCFNHASPRTTLRYLGIEREEIRDVFLNPIGG